MTTLKMLYGFAARRYRHPDGSAIFTNDPTEVLADIWSAQKPKRRTERYVRPDKLGAVWLALNELRASLHDWQSVAGVDVARFAFLTGCRRREVTTLTWDRARSARRPRQVPLQAGQPEARRRHLAPAERPRGRTAQATPAAQRQQVRVPFSRPSRPHRRCPRRHAEGERGRWPNPESPRRPTHVQQHRPALSRWQIRDGHAHRA